MEDEIRRPSLPKFLYDHIENDVVDLYTTLALDIPLNPYQVVKKLGYTLRYFSEINDTDQLEALINAQKLKRDGLSYYDADNKTYVIWINDIDITNRLRQGFTIMHEIGHIRLGHKQDSALAEKEANYYAAYSLVPSPLVHRLNCETFIEIAECFNVSIECAYNCSLRSFNWTNYGGRIKPYEQKLLNYYKSIGRGD